MANKKSTPLTETPAYKLTNAIYRWFVVSLLWILCSFPLFTIGAATTAAIGEFSDPENYYSHKLIREYFRRFKRCFSKTTLIWLMVLALSLLLVLDVSFYRQFVGNGSWIFPAIMAVLGNLMLGIFRFSCYVASKMEACSVKSLVMQSVKLMLCCLPIWAVMVAMDLAMITTFFRIPYLLFLIVLLPGIYSDIHSKLIGMFLKRFETEE